MHKITVKGTALTLYPDPSELHGVRASDNDDEFTQYFSKCHNEYDPHHQQELIDKGVVNGRMSFIFEGGQLWTITTYESREELTMEELEKLQEYTTGQWSDGIGEGFEQFSCHRGRIMHDPYEDGDITSDVFISPWHKDQIATITQIPI